MNKSASLPARPAVLEGQRQKLFDRHFLAVILIGMILPGWAAGQALPENDGQEHLGVKSCSASTCHGAVTERSTYSVLQNEYHTWTRDDQHSRAYETLLSERSQRIAKNLDIGKAHEAKICLDCHADNVPPERRGRFFNISDGVGCEACHGGAESWLGPHISGAASHAENLRLGMYPTEEPAARGRLCLSCHLGTENKFANHRIMGAGHPRLSFELATFTALQPAHYRIDADYRRRKSVAPAAVEWLDGMLQGADQNLALLGEHFETGKAFPELALFDCHSCHHSFDQLRWQASEFSGETQPGGVTLEDSRLRMVALLEQGVLQTTSTLDGLRRLHAATEGSRDELQAAIVDLRRLVDAAGVRLQQQASANGAERFRQVIYEAAAAGQFNDYADAEQAAMAVQTLAAGSGQDAGTKAVFSALADQESYDPAAAAKALAAMGGLKPSATVMPMPRSVSETDK